MPRPQGVTSQAAAGGFTVLNVRVPHERADKGTVKVDLRLPDGFYFLSYKKVPGWKVKLTRQKLDTPIDLGGYSVSERFTRVAWTGAPDAEQPATRLTLMS